MKTKQVKRAKKLTGWDKLDRMKKYQLDANGWQPDIPKSVYVRLGIWAEQVEEVMTFGYDEAGTRKIFKEEYGCSDKEIDGYFRRFEIEDEMTALTEQMAALSHEAKALAATAGR